jgi:hypothetical protein
MYQINKIGPDSVRGRKRELDAYRKSVSWKEMPKDLRIDEKKKGTRNIFVNACMVRKE